MHTPGPWKIDEEGFVVSGPDDFDICDISLRKVGTDTEEMLANARLIAAAPELLSALEKFLKTEDLSNAAIESGDVGELEAAEEEIATLYYEAVNEARAIIAKAKGS